MVFSWFNTQKVDAFVDAEIADLVKRVPPANLEGEGNAAKSATDRLARSHDLLLRHARDFVRRERPNLYQKTRIASRMKWALLDAKYPKSFVEEFSYALATVVAAASSEREV